MMQIASNGLFKLRVWRLFVTCLDPELSRGISWPAILVGAGNMLSEWVIMVV
jgi:hypothetical protein